MTLWFDHLCTNSLNINSSCFSLSEGSTCKIFKLNDYKLLQNLNVRINENRIRDDMHMQQDNISREMIWEIKVYNNHRFSLH
jgi:hypothetical protein